MTATPALPLPIAAVPFWRSAALWRRAVPALAADLAILAACVAVYVLKRRMMIDVFPGFDSLPDDGIEAVLRALAGMLLV